MAKLGNLALFMPLISSLLVSVAAAQTPGVVVTIKPIHSLVAGIIGKTGEPRLLLNGNTSLHGTQLKPSQTSMLQNADIIFYIGETFEVFLKRVFKTLPDKVRKVAIMDDQTIIKLRYRNHDLWGDQPQPVGDLHDFHHALYNGHIWLDPKNAMRIVRLLTDKLIQRYPENRDIYLANAEQLIQDLAQLDNEIQRVISPVTDKPFIVFHDAYQYFEQAYGLTAVGSIVISPEEIPSPRRVQRMQKRLVQSKAHCVFSEPQFSDRLITTIIEGTPTKKMVLDPLGATLPAGEALYFNLLRNLTNNLSDCLSS